MNQPPNVVRGGNSTGVWITQSPPEIPTQRDADGILLEAAGIVAGARNATHGDKERSFVAIAAVWTAYLAARKDPAGAIRPHDVAHMMVLLKQQRAEYGTPVRDHFTDAAGYSAIAGEILLVNLRRDDFRTQAHALLDNLLTDRPGTSALVICADGDSGPEAVSLPAALSVKRGLIDTLYERLHPEAT